MQFSKQDISKLDKVYRLNLINSITGVKPANLIGSFNPINGSNLAIISSVVHLGSNPPLLGFIMRPSHDVKRDTYKNISELGFYTVNSLPISHIHNGHYTSAKFPENISEFERCKFTEEYFDDFPVPFVKESNIQIGLKLVEEVLICLNNTRLMIGEVHFLNIKSSVHQNGMLNLEKMNIAGIGGLNQYYSLKKENEFPYARVDEMPF